MSEFTTFVGVDAHNKSLVASLVDQTTGLIAEAKFAMDAKGRQRFVKWARKEASGPILACYEAGCLGFDLQRKLAELGLACQVVAPSLVLQRGGRRRRKNDWEDARELRKQLAHGLLTEVHPPTEAEEAVRALVRCREDERLTLHAARQRVLKLLNLWGVRWPKDNWTKEHQAWLPTVRLPQPQVQAALDNYLLAVAQAEQRLAELDRQIAELAEQEPYREPVARLRCLRGFDTLSAMIVVSELYSFARFSDARGVMGYVGLIPGEYSSGESEKPRGITKAGNAYVRRILIQAAWHYKAKPRASKSLAKKQAGQPPQMVALADRAWRRLHRRYWQLESRGKIPKVAVTAVARELAGFVWAALQIEDGQCEAA